MKQVKNNYSKYLEAAGMLFFFAIVVFGILCATGTLTSGYHMVDDHEILEWVYNMRYQNYSVWDVIVKILKNDFNIRYRPLYCIIRVFQSYVFGINMVAFSIFNGIVIVLSMLFLYYCGRYMRASRWCSVLFALISLAGYQAAVWWKIGPQESLGTMLFALGFYLLLKWLETEKKILAIGSLLVFFLMCNYKESFMLLLPFAGLYVVYDSVKDEERLPALSEIFKRMKSRIWYIICLLLFFIYVALAVVFIVGATGYDGFNIHESLSIRDYYGVFRSSLDGDLKWYNFFIPLLLGVLLTFWEDLKKLWKEILLFLVFILPQFVLYAQTGISERYMLPAIVGVAWFFTVAVFSRKLLSGKRKAVYIAGLLLLLLANARGMIIEADYFRYRGESVTGMLETVEKLSDDNDIKILSCFRPNEEANWTVYYWMMLHEHDNLYFWTEESQTINRVCDYHYPYDSNDMEVFGEHEYEEMDMILMYNQNDRHYCYAPSLDDDDFEKTDIGSMTIWIRKGRGSVPDVPDVRKPIYG